MAEFSFGEPDARSAQRFLAQQAGGHFSYEAVGATRGAFPAGFDHDRNRVKIGEGSAAFEAARAALLRWAQFPTPWTRIVPAEAAIVEGATVAVLIRIYGVWWVNAARIVYTIDEAVAEGEIARRFGYAYGTLAAHLESGEERFCVEMDRAGAVWYDLQAFSRPRLWLARLGKPLARRGQRRFVRESQAAMIAAARGGGELGACLQNLAGVAIQIASRFRRRNSSPSWMPRMPGLANPAYPIRFRGVRHVRLDPFGPGRGGYR